MRARFGLVPTAVSKILSFKFISRFDDLNLYFKLKHHYLSWGTSAYHHRGASFFFGVRIWLVKVLGQFSINYFRGLGLRIRVRVWVRV